MSNATIIIPARYGSSRFPAKPLAKVGDAPLIEQVWRRAQRLGWRTIVATDDVGIANCVQDFGGEVAMTREHANGTERCAAVAKRLGIEGVVVNWQGDSPLVPIEWVQQLVAEAEAKPRVTTPVMLCNELLTKRIQRDAASGHPAATTVAMKGNFEALYFSKSPVPFNGPMWMHIGIYAFSHDVLAMYGKDVAPTERSEGLEQLRWLNMGRRVQCVPVQGEPIWEVNYPADIAIVEKLMEEERARMRS